MMTCSCSYLLHVWRRSSVVHARRELLREAVEGLSGAGVWHGGFVIYINDGPPLCGPVVPSGAHEPSRRYSLSREAAFEPQARLCRSNRVTGE